ncbi:MAG TPA: tetratricopeptide repeat protein [Actinocrinis sp.]
MSAVLKAADTVGQPDLTARLARSFCPHLLRQGYFAEAAHGYAIGIAAARATGDDAMAAILYRRLGSAYLGVNRLDEAFEACLELERFRGAAHGSAQCLANIGIVHIRSGGYREARDCLQRALDLLQDVGTAHDRGAVLGSMGVVQTYLGLHEKALETHRRALELNGELGSRYLESATIMNIGWVHTLRGVLDAALADLRSGLASGGDAGSAELECRSLNFLADCHRRLGRTEEAIGTARDGLVLTRRLGDRGIEQALLFTLGNAHRDRGALDQARDCYERGVSLIADELAAPSVAGYAGLGRVAEAAGEYERAAEHLGRALAIAERGGLPQADELRAWLRALPA